MKLLALLGMAAVGLTVVADDDLDEQRQLYLNATRLDKIKLGDSRTVNRQWTSFKSYFRKAYTGAEDIKRKDLFKENINKILRHNKAYALGTVKYKLGLNQFSDKFKSETISVLRGFKGSSATKLSSTNYYKSSGKAKPSHVDWSLMDSAPIVKNQGMCGSCYSFATSSGLEYQARIHRNDTFHLSQQELVDCVSANLGCNGGYVSKSLEYVIRNGGIATDDSYPYIGEQQETCRKTNLNVKPSVKKYFRIAKGDCDGAMDALAIYGPLIGAVDSTPNMLFYETGIYEDPDCSNNTVNHAVLAVGYNIINPHNKYWKIQNSWGRHWGENGYMRIKMDHNHCGFLNQQFIGIY